jgi:hypothetical protein
MLEGSHSVSPPDTADLPQFTQKTSGISSDDLSASSKLPEFVVSGKSRAYSHGTKVRGGA